MNRKDVKLYCFPEDRPLINSRFAVVDFKEAFEGIKTTPVYRTGLYCFFLVTEGSAEIIVNGYSERISAQTLVCGIPGDLWDWSDIENLSGWFVCFEAPFLLSALKGGFSLEPITSLNSQSHYPFIRLSERKHRRMSDIVEDMNETLDDCPINYDLLRALLWQFVFISEKEYNSNASKNREGEVSNFIPTFISLVNKYFNVSHETRFYADKMNISPNYLNKIVKANLGISSFDFIMNRVFSEAKLLLRLTDIDIKELTFTLGFDNPNYFIRLFKKAEGITPTDFRKNGTL